jgi:hypothetical protein
MMERRVCAAIVLSVRSEERGSTAWTIWWEALTSSDAGSLTAAHTPRRSGVPCGVVGDAQPSAALAKPTRHMWTALPDVL